ncbi:TolC family protein (plasmid) [Vibrio sp. SS-MA-C1-2]|uniref:TolC family protein n=1 Tax=Vibrio sp. SS-MA-C1-2 TaxID=2908646 RepID=UPI001F1DD892|nr:TolC family protein [Vibrio sp. SS-MA-C1-2]UJF20311.1 TolC family protein [Vibrio sp. SS-MA-C1-2]
MEENQYNIDIRRANFLPTLDANANTTWNKDRESNEQHGASDDTPSYNSHGYGVTLNQSIINVGDIFQYGTAKLNYNIEQITHEQLTFKIPSYKFLCNILNS